MVNKQQHIVFLTPGFPESENDSTTIPALQVFLKHMRLALTEAKMVVIPFQYPFIKEKYTWHNIEVIPLNGQNKRLLKFIIWQKALRLLDKMHKKLPITTIHSFWIGECSTIGQRFAKKHRLNHIITAMGQDAIISNRHYKQLKKGSQTIVTLSKNHQEYLEKTSGLSSEVIPWFIDTSTFPKPKENTIDILGVGSLNSVKNYTNFIDVILRLKETHKNLKVVIVGDGNLKNNLETKIKKLNLESTITLLGKVPRQEVLKLMAQSKLLLHTSNYESFGFVFLEALYLGLRIVSYNLGIAKPIDQWCIGQTERDLVLGCDEFLKDTSYSKEQIELTSKLETINAYISLYNA